MACKETVFGRMSDLRRRRRIEQLLVDALDARLAARMRALLISEAGVNAVTRIDQGDAHLPELVDELMAVMCQQPDGNALG